MASAGSSKILAKIMAPGTAEKGKKSLPKLKKSPGKPSSSGKMSHGKASTTKKTTDNMSMVDFKKYLAWHEAKKVAIKPQSTASAKRSKK